MSDARWVCRFVATIVGGTVALLAVILWSVAWAEGSACETRADEMRRDHRYGLIAGCRVETDDGQFVPIDNLRITNEEDG